MTTKRYSNGEITVVWKPEICVHSKKCWLQLGQVFRPRERPWITMSGAPTQSIREQVEKCPSKALSWEEGDTTTKEDAE